MSLPDRIAILNSDGTTDTSFDPGLGVDDIAYTVGVLSSGKVVVGGAFTQVDVHTRPKLAVFEADGTLDPLFEATPNNTVRTLALQTDGSVIFGGDFTNVNGSTRNRIARLESDLTLEPAYNPNAGGTVYGLLNQEDGKTIAVGAFTTVGGITRNRIARLYNDEAPKTLSVLSVDLIQWLRGGSSPEVERVSFELSTDGGTTYADLAGTITRIVGGWQLVPASSLTGDGIIRARAYPTDSHSEGILEDTVTFDVNPEIEVSQGSTILVDGVSTVNFADTQLGSFRDVTITITNIGLTSLDLDGSPNKIALTTGTQWSVVSQPTSPIEFGESVNFTLRFTPTSAGAKTDTVTIDNNDPNEDPFTFGLSGECLPGPGSVDTSWQVTPNNTVIAVALNASDDVCIGGEFTTVNTLNRKRFASIRDATHATPLSVLPQTGSIGNGEVYCFCQLPDGKLLVGGTFTLVNGVTCNRLARFTSSGEFDASFNVNGSVSALALQADGSVIVGGNYTRFNGVVLRGSGLVKLTPSGTLDTSFNSNLGTIIFGIATQTDGKLIVYGLNPASSTRRVVRLNADGSQDLTFSADINDSLSTALLTKEGYLLIGGSYSQIGEVNKRGLNRLTSTGALDPSFSELQAAVRSLALQCDGKIIAGSSSSGTLASTERLVRLSATGADDPTFVAAARNIVSGLGLQSDGKVIVVGQFTLAGGTTKYASRLINDSGAATSVLSVVSETEVQWLRGGTLPETQVVVFHYSQDAGITWTSLGQGTRIAGGWRLSSIALPISGLLRAQAYISCGRSNGSTSIHEEQVTFSNLSSPDLVVEYPVGTVIADNGTATLPGTLAQQTSDAIITLRNTGNANLSSIVASFAGSAGDFSIVSAPAASVAPNGTTTLTLRFSPPTNAIGVKVAAVNITSNLPGSKNPYKVNLRASAVGIPVATTGSNSAPASGQRTLNGTFRANHDTASAYFQYKLKSGNTWTNSSATTISGFTVVPVSQVITGLTSGQVYEYRAIIYNAVNSNELIPKPPFTGDTREFTAT
jgi:uncharacterized delta-60 repeat protein